MAKLFNEKTQILYQKPEFTKGYYSSEPLERCLLLPMCAYKVSVHYPIEKGLNLFQETILRLLNIRNISNENIAEKLSLNADLVELIINELKNQSLIDNNRLLTEKGHNALRDEDDNYEIKIGFVFYSYITKTFMDAFILENEMCFAEVKSRQKNKVEFFIYESVGDKIFKEGTIVHTSNEKEKIDVYSYDVINILKKHKKRQNMLIPDEISPIKGFEYGFACDNESVSVLESPMPIYVATNIALSPDDIINRSNIQMCYPFGIGFASNLLDAVLYLKDKDYNSDVNEVIIDLKNEAFGMTEQQLQETQKEQTKVNVMIAEILSDNIKNYYSIYRMLITVENKFVHIKSLFKNNIGNNYDYIQKEMNDYIVDNYNLIAEILIEVGQKHPNFSNGMLTKYQNENSDFLCDVAKKIGFTDDENRFKRFFSLKKASIENACSSCKVDALIAYNLIVADRVSTHPFYRLAKYVPQFITYLGKLIKLRNEGKHGNDVEYNFNTIAAYSIKNMYIAYLLLDGLTFNYYNNFNFKNESLIDTNRIKVSKSAESEVDRIYSPNAKKYGTVLNKLVSLQVEILLKGDEYPGRVSEVLEAIFKQICKSRLNSNARLGIRAYREVEDDNTYLNEMKKYGFEVDTIPYYDLQKLIGTFNNYHNATLSTLFYAWFFSEKVNNEKVLYEIAKKIPLLIEVIISTNTNRKHIGKKEYDSVELEFLKKNIDNTINSLIDFMAENDL